MDVEELAQLLVARFAEFGTATVWVGDTLLSIVSFNGTHDEDLAIEWANEVDGFEVLAVFPMNDGRDFTLCKRLHTKQSVLEAVVELQEAIEKRFA